jgi:hypothetical protein
MAKLRTCAALAAMLIAAPALADDARPGEICLETARDQLKSYAKAVCGKFGNGTPATYFCVFSKTDAATCWKNGKCYVCSGSD